VWPLAGGDFARHGASVKAELTVGEQVVRATRALRRYLIAAAC
jgi:hypothetical protein